MDICGLGCFPKPARPAPLWSAHQDTAMGADCFDHPRQQPTLTRRCGSSTCWGLRSLPLSSTDYAPSVEGGLPLAEPASVGTDRHPLLPVHASRYRPGRGMIFHLLFSYPGACRPALVDAGDSGSRALAPLEVEQGTVFIGIALLKSRRSAIITYLFRRVNTNLIFRSHKVWRGSIKIAGTNQNESYRYTLTRTGAGKWYVVLFILLSLACRPSRLACAPASGPILDRRL